MDTSETYIKMSHAAFTAPDVMPSPPAHKVQEHIYVDSSGQWWADYDGWFIPLYRQDQLQEMMRGTWGLMDKPETFIRDFANFVLGFSYPIKFFDTLEQWGLACVMHEKYSKRWNGTEWVK